MLDNDDDLIRAIVIEIDFITAGWRLLAFVGQGLVFSLTKRKEVLGP